jgi:amino acid adenylation domain-containing protein/non-ribosomal peptide synthase protein (TIGR01720 family)
MTDTPAAIRQMGPRQRADLAYWQDRLSGPLAGGSLPTDRKRSSVPVLGRRTLSWTVPADVGGRIAGVAKGSPALTLATVAAGLAVCLHRYEGRPRVSFGTPTRDTEPAQVLPVIVDLEPSSTFRALLSSVRTTIAEAYEHAGVTMAHVAETLPREAVEAPLFTVGITVTGHSDEVPATGDDLSLALRLEAEAIHVDLAYNHRLFDVATVERFLGHLATVLATGLENLDAPLDTVDLVGEVERAELVGAALGPAAEADQATVHGLFAEQAARTPDATALLGDGTSVTYGDLLSRARQIAALLRRRGVRRGDVVGVCAGRSADAVVWLLGVLEADAAYLPMDPTSPDERLAATAASAGVVVVLAAQDGAQARFGSGVVVVSPGEVAEADGLSADHDPTRVGDAGTPAYVMVTSGSTGLPKAIEMPHRALVNLLRWQHRQSVEVSDGPVRTLARTPLWFDVSFQEIFATLCFGGTLVVAEAGAERDPALVASMVDEYRVGRVFFPFVGLQQFVVECVRRGLRLPSLREVITSGEQLKRFPALVDFFRANPDCTLRNQYGPTETHVVTSFTLEGPPTRWPELPPIGTPIDGAAVHVLDESLRPVPVGVAGELCVGGNPLATGYRGDPELTAAQFVQGGPLAVRLYRTGDLARRREDGAIEFLGRRDRQLKIRGHRIEPGEIESLLLRHHAVSAAVVVSRDDESGRTRLVAYVVPAESFGADVDFRDHLRGSLPQYAVPNVFSLLDALPTTATGKVDADALPEPVDYSADSAARFAGPRSELEQALITAWCRLLGVEQVGVSDHFLELGGDSIIATQAVAAANDLGLGITMKDFFAHPTIAEQAALAAGRVTSKADRGDDHRDAPLTPIQRWFVDLDFVSPDHYNFGVLVTTDERLDAGHVRRALEQLVARHEALATVFAVGAQASRDIAPADAVSVAEVAVPDAASLPAAVLAAAEAAHARIDRTAGPLVTATLLPTDGPDADRLLLVTHHLVIDGVSLRVLLEEFQTIYRSLVAGQDPVLPVRSSSYKEWATRLSAYAASEAARSELPYWSAVPARPVAALPVGDGGLEREARRAEFTLNETATDILLRELPVKCRARIEEVLLTCLFEGLRAWTGHRSLLVSFEGHGRESVLPELDLTRTVGWFSTMYPVEFAVGTDGDTDADIDERDVLAVVKDVMRAVPNRGIGYGVLRHLSPSPEVRSALAGASRPQVAFNYLGRFDAQVDSSSIFGPALEPIGPLVAPDNHRPWPLYFQGHVVGGRAHFFLEHASTEVDTAVIAAVMERFGTLLRSFIERRDSEDLIEARRDGFADAGLTGDEVAALLRDIAANNP